MNDALAWLTEAAGKFAGVLWSSPLTMLALLGTGVFLSLRLGLVQVRGFGDALRLLFRRPTDDAEGEVPLWRALGTALSATIGTGNIAGVATALSLGGPGALFWMWLTALVGMATKFTECTLALRFRHVGSDGVVAGGAMFTLSRGLGMHRTACAFAVFALIASCGIGNMVQANSVVDGLGYVLPVLREQPAWAGVVLSVTLGLVIVGGVRRIAAVAGTLVPVMCVLYLGAGLLVVLRHLGEVPAALAQIVRYALDPQAAGAAALGEAMRWGVARGLFSNESGLGSAPMAIAAARVQRPIHGGLVSMLGPFLDTLIICTITGLVILLSGGLEQRSEELVGAALTAHAFQLEFGAAGAWVVGIGLTLFAFSTMIGWSYYGDRCAFFLFGQRAVLPYRIFYTVIAGCGTMVALPLVWNLSDIANLAMALPNLLSLLLLSGLAARLYKDHRTGADDGGA